MNLIDELEQAKGLLSEHPYLGSTRFAMETNIPELRSLSLPRFPYIVFYTAQGDTIRILRVLHTARDIPARFSEDEV
ncbi:toxin ParE1/3/4 [Enteractinococcus fodinae]|uniref:Toxin ParE1/3/4 n=2 Tax=Enteractinococcus fodinae TaxID=684663 RepID=A0ABU2B4V4_9MICC|nr:toxin ParE1/3/4 [Enteractinococcus fodinae]